jgi:serine/threonine protein kinase
MDKRHIGPFEIVDQLGVGGMGIVYRAIYTKTKQKVALKVLTPTMVENEQVIVRFEREINILKKMRHPNIVRYFGGGKSQSQRFYAMELIDGGSLEDVLKKKKKLSWEQTIDCAREIAKALEHAHSFGIIHRDLKPANIFISKKGKLKLGDFGIARDTEATALTAAGKTVGTYAYMAPEQISGQTPVSRKTDLYALGCVLYELLTGRPPFVASTPAEILFNHLQDDPDRVTTYAIDCPLELEEIIEKLLEKNPDDRFFDALALQVALDEVKEKLSQKASVAKKSMSGESASYTSEQDAAELKKILGKKKKRKKKKKQIPVYERLWFLLVCLFLSISFVAWAMWPLNDQQLLAKARSYHDPVDYTNWDLAQATYQELIDRDPDSHYADTARESIQEIEMETAERRADNNQRNNRIPKSEAERQYMKAKAFDDFGDPLTALEKYNSIVELFQDTTDKKNRPFVNLSLRRIEKLNEEGFNNSERSQIVNNSLLKAESYHKNSRYAEAREVFRSIESLYKEDKQFEKQVAFARARLDNREVDPFPFDEYIKDEKDPETNDSNSEDTGSNDSDSTDN